jgi:hypothetical protein
MVLWPKLVTDTVNKILLYWTETNKFIFVSQNYLFKLQIT